MLSTPGKRFAWARPAREGGFTFFGMMMLKRRRVRERIVIKEQKTQDRRWKPAPWTPWLWIK